MPRISKKHRRNLPAPRDRATGRYFTYARVSSQEQADRDLSIPAQLKAIHDYAGRRGYVILEDFIDIESAKEPGRLHFSDMMARLQRDPRVAGVIIHKVDSLLRNFRDFVLVDDLMKAGVDFQFVTGSYDNSPVGQLGLGIQVLFAKHYLDNLSQEVKKGMNERMLEKRKWSFFAPLGYLNHEREIIPDSERFTLLRAAWQRYATGAHTLTTLADWLYAQGLRTRGSRRHPGGVRVGEAALHAVLNNPFYYGMMRYKGQLIPGSHDPMIAKQVFDRVNEILHDRGTPHPALKDFTYRGFLFCGECGCMVTAEDKVKFYPGTNRQAVYVYYHCSRSKGRCVQPPIREDALEAQLAEQLQTLVIPDGVLGLVRQAIQESHGQEKQFRDAAMTALRRRQDDIQKKQDVLLDRLLDGTVPQGVYHEKYTALQNEKAEILVELEAHERVNERWFVEAEALVSFANRLSEIFAKDEPGQKMRVLRVVASDATLQSRKARLNLRPAFSLLAKSRSHQSWLRG